jgi:hypothetical protein
MFFSFVTLFTALAISGVAAWYSIAGLMAIFASAAIPIAIMGGVLEAGKLVTASWLYQNWKTAPKLLKAYLTSAVIILMFITSMGIFGFLSKAHIDQTVLGGDNTLQIQELDLRIASEQRKIDDAQLVIEQLDSTVQTLIDYDRIRGEDGAIAVRENQSVERSSLATIISEASEQIKQIRNEKQTLLKEQLRFEAEVGPIKYIAELFVKDSRDVIDDAVRWVIITIIFVFDPLAVLLIIAANISLSKPKTLRKAVNVHKVDDEWQEIDVETD